MKTVDSLLNRSEEVAFRELQSIAADNNLKVFSKTRLSDVIQKDRTFLTQREFDFYTRMTTKTLAIGSPAYTSAAIFSGQGQR